MLSQLERPAGPAPSLRQVLADAGPTYLANGLIAFIFAATGPVAVILAVGTGGGLSQGDLASWVFGVFFINGLITLAMSWRYRTPLGFGWTIPGTVLVGPALQHMSFAEVIGAFYATSVLILVLGASGWVKRVMSWLPMPIVMGMVAGVFLRFGLDLVRALHSDVAVAAPMVLAFIVLSANADWAKRMPPVIGALLVGAVTLALLGRVDAAVAGQWSLAQPLAQAPVWSLAAMVELVVPLAITVLVVQNGQGVAVLKAARHDPPVNAIAFVCGLGAAASALVGAVSTCLTGPSNAMMSATPKAFIMVLGGLAMVRVLQGAFTAAFGAGRFTLGALVSLLVTVADLSLLNIGAAFWGLVAGFLVAWWMERPDFGAAPKS